MNTDTPTSLEIGQVIFCISSENGALYPVQVTEEVVHKSISGTKKTYTVRLDLYDDHGEAQTKIASLDELKDQWFPTLEGAKQFMLKQATDFIESMAANAEKLAMISFGNEITKQPVVDHQTEDHGASGTASIRRKPTVTMPDGSKIELET